MKNTEELTELMIPMGNKKNSTISSIDPMVVNHTENQNTIYAFKLKIMKVSFLLQLCLLVKTYLINLPVSDTPSKNTKHRPLYVATMELNQGTVVMVKNKPAALVRLSK